MRIDLIRQPTAHRRRASSLVAVALASLLAACGGAHTVPGGLDSEPDAGDGDADHDADHDQRRDPDADLDDICETDCFPFEWEPPPPCDPDCGDRECGLDPVCREARCGECDEPSATCDVDGRCAENPCPEGMVPVAASGFCIDRFEASQGGPGGEARSVAGVMPWVDVTWYQARLACELAGKRLCTTEEWEAACSGPDGWPYPYGETYHPYLCNGPHNDLRTLAPSRYMDLCEGGYPGLFDMSGNAMEWTATCVGTSGCNVRGGSYLPTVQGSRLGCFERGSGPIGPVDGWQHDSLGFRCCRDL